MKRKEFLEQGCKACIGLAIISPMLSGCRSVSYIAGNMVSDGVTIAIDSFVIKGSKQKRNYVIVNNEALLFPICVFRISDTTYSALWMRCTHQGAALQVSGDMLQCAAHGSEFDSSGKRMQGPAEENLRVFPVSQKEELLFIDLRRI